MMFVNEKLQEFERYIKGKKVALVGLDTSNVALIDYFAEIGANVTVFDYRNIDEIDKEILDKITARCINFSFGEHNLINLIGFDLIFRSPIYRPDCPEIKAESIRGAIITSEIEMVIDLCPGKVIGVTGSNGKTTTASLIYAILKEKGYDCFFGGDTGTSLLTRINEMKPECIVVLELSSFQLMDIQSSPEIAVITNMSKGCNDGHNSFDEYIKCKKNIFKYQSENGKVVLNYDNEITNEFASEVMGKVRFFSSKNKLDNGVIYDNGVIKSCEDGVRMHIMTIDDAISIYGIHNYENICAAVAATEDLADPYTQSRAITKFNGIEHRLELVRNINGVKWYDDSLGVTPTRTIAGLKAFKEKVVLISGGYDKHQDYKCIAKPIIENVSKLILTGPTADKIEEAVLEQLKEEKLEIPIYKFDTLEECVEKANKIANEKEIVLFSPASASLDMYTNLTEKGERFKKLVEEIDN